MRTGRRKMMNRLLPFRYIPLKYISNPNKTIIKTDFYWSSDTSIYITIEIINKTVSSIIGSTNKFSANEGWQTGSALGFGISQNGVGIRYFWDTGPIQDITSVNTPMAGCLDSRKPTKIGKIYTLSIIDRKAFRDGKIEAVLSNKTFKTPFPIRIFSLNKPSSQNSTLGSNNYKIYRITTKGDVEADLIPCKRKTDGIIGMYDLVGRKFYTSPNNVAFTGG